MLAAAAALLVYDAGAGLVRAGRAFLPRVTGVKLVVSGAVQVPPGAWQVCAGLGWAGCVIAGGAGRVDAGGAVAFSNVSSFAVYSAIAVLMAVPSMA
jgi:hypothetical protein